MHIHAYSNLKPHYPFPHLSLLVYVDDTIITGTNQQHINSLKMLLNHAFKLKDFGNLKYFLGLESARFSKGIYISQHHYTLELLKDSGLLGAKFEILPMDPFLKLRHSDKDFLEDPTAYWWTFIPHNL